MDLVSPKRRIFCCIQVQVNIRFLLNCFGTHNQFFLSIADKISDLTNDYLTVSFGK